MNPITNMKNLNKMNDRELEMGLAGTKNSWHASYSDSAWIFIGGLPYELSEGDVICVFSQYGEIVHINLVRDLQTGKSKGFAFVCYEDQRSTVLAVDNLNGAKVLGRLLRVDHVQTYKLPKNLEKLDADRKKLLLEGCAPKPVEEQQTIAKADSEEDINKDKDKKKKKKEKKKKKSKKKKRSSSSEESDSESEDSSPEVKSKIDGKSRDKVSKDSRRNRSNSREKMSKDSRRNRSNSRENMSKDSRRNRSNSREKMSKDTRRNRSNSREKMSKDSRSRKNRSNSRDRDSRRRKSRSRSRERKNDRWR